jgi:hypothetical protein
MVTMADSLLVVDESVVGSAVGHLTFEVPGENALIDTFVSVRNDEEAEQGSLNSTLRWSTSSSWTNNGDIYFFADIQEIDSPGYLGAEFSGADTASATQNYVEYQVYGCPGDRVHVDLCDERATCNGDTYIRLFSPSGEEVDNNDDSCGLCSSLSYVVSGAAAECEYYVARLGCYDDSSCSGTPWFRTSTTNQTRTFKSWRTRETLTYGDNQYRASTYMFDKYSEYLSAFGSGQYSVDNAYKW